MKTIGGLLEGKTPSCWPPMITNSNSSSNNNNIYFAKGQVNQKGKSPSKLATILEKKKNCATNI